MYISTVCDSMYMARIVTQKGVEYCPTCLQLERKLKERAKALGINFSKTLTEALQNKLDGEVSDGNGNQRSA
jgi:post-segregation antitoxin (ccd killing protein)